MAEVRWMPLESNPDVMNRFMTSLGVPGSWGFTDVFGLDEELLCMIPQPCCAFILLFPITEGYYKGGDGGEGGEGGGVTEGAGGVGVSDNIFFMKQTIRNACGTIGVIHAVANSTKYIAIPEESVIGKFLRDAAPMGTEEKGKRLENDVSISDVHRACATEGQTAAMSAEDKLDLHFVALVQVDGCLYELDGCKPTPVNHGPSSEGTFVADAAHVCREFIKRNQNDLRFTIVALSKLS